MEFTERKRQAIDDVRQALLNCGQLISTPDTCARDEGNLAVAQAAASSFWSALAGPNEAELRQRIAACRLRVGQQRMDAILLQQRYIILGTKLVNAQNDDQLEAAYADLPPATLKTLLLKRIDAAIAKLNEGLPSDGVIAAAASLMPGVASAAQPLQSLRTELKSYRNRINSATTSVEIMRLYSEAMRKVIGARDETYRRVGAVAGTGAAGMAADALPAIADAAARAAGHVLETTAAGFLGIIWAAVKPLLPYVVIGGVGYYVWRNRSDLFGKTKPVGGCGCTR